MSKPPVYFNGLKLLAWGLQAQAGCNEVRQTVIVLTKILFMQLHN
jgi:hypothetical protein